MKSDLINRLRGEYRIPIVDGLGPAGGEEPDNPNEFVRTFETTPIQKEAALAIEELIGVLTLVKEQCLFDGDNGLIGVSEDVVIPSELFEKICEVT